MEKICEYCNGSGFINAGFTSKEYEGKKIAIYPYAEPCYCRINKIINNRFRIFEGVGDAHPEDSDVISEKYSTGNYIFLGTEDKFLYITKCFFLKGVMYKNYLILEGGNIVEQYNAPSSNSSGEWLTTSYLNQYDLLVILFTTSARYGTLKDCVLDVVKNRHRINKPTWIYSYSLDSLKNAKEYSSELEMYFNFYKTVDISKFSKLKGYVPRTKVAKEKEREINDRLANI